MKNRILICYRLVSPFHLLSMMTYIKSKQEQYDQIFVVINHYWGYSILDPQYYDYLEKKNIKFIEDIDLKEIIKNGGHICVMSVNKFNLRMLRYVFTNKISFITIEDGLGAYSNFMSYCRAVFRESKGFVKSSVYLGAYFLDKILKKIFTVDDFRLFMKKNGEVNITYKENFKKVMLDLVDSSIDYPINKPSIIFCSQPYENLGLLTRSEMGNILTFLNEYAKSKGCMLWIKKHPAENANSFDSEQVIDFSGTMEELVFADSNHHIKEIIGFNSSSLLNCAAIFDKKCLILDIELNNLIIKKNSQLVIDMFNRYTSLLSITSY